MGLRDGYGVLIGTLSGYRRDDPNDFGRFMHGVLIVSAPDGSYKCAVDVDTRNGVIPIHWRIQPLRIAEWAPLLALPNGWHFLMSVLDSGAVDFIRDPRLKDIYYIPEIPELVAEPQWPPIPPEELISRYLPHRMPIETKRSPVAFNAYRRASTRARTREVKQIKMHTLMRKLLMYSPPWNAGSSDQALSDLEAVLAAPHRVMVFGEPFSDGNKGVHNIHQNQGDLVGGGHDAENAIWQDGVTVVFRQDGTAAAFMNKFDTQSDTTDNDGRPLP